MFSTRPFFTTFWVPRLINLLLLSFSPPNAFSSFQKYAVWRRRSNDDVVFRACDLDQAQDLVSGRDGHALLHLPEQR
ncbi:MAG TPA: hypothetical protein VG759_10505 [Candidatus Angelobacter sp.]|nr:hypothetical protein [Candidatus Angelobacter sp.]